MVPSSIIIRRFAVAAAFGVTFMVMASIISPMRSRAERQPSSATPEPAPLSRSAFTTDPHEGLAHLGTIADARHVVEIYATDAGPRYSIYDEAGEELGVLMTPARVSEVFPDLNIEQFDTDTPASSPIMRADMPLDLR